MIRTDIPQATPNFREIVTPLHRQENGIPSVSTNGLFLEVQFVSNVCLWLLADSFGYGDLGPLYPRKQMGWMAPAPGIALCQSVVSIKDHEQKEPSAMNVTTVGLDLAKNVFQVHGIDSTGGVIVRRSLRRRQMMPFFGKLP